MSTDSNELLSAVIYLYITADYLKASTVLLVKEGQFTEDVHLLRLSWHLWQDIFGIYSSFITSKVVDHLVQKMIWQAELFAILLFCIIIFFFFFLPCNTDILFACLCSISFTKLLSFTVKGKIITLVLSPSHVLLPETLMDHQLWLHCRFLIIHTEIHGHLLGGALWQFGVFSQHEFTPKLKNYYSEQQWVAPCLKLPKKAI